MRSFNRLVTQRVGALNDHYLSRDRPLGEARVLWEIGVDGCDVRRLRSRLGLDSGYLSRLLRSLERARLVTVAPSEADRRVRTARLTPAGRAERELLDRRSDELARSFLEPLSDRQRDAPGRRDGRGRAAADRCAGRDRRSSTRRIPMPSLPPASTSPSSAAASTPGSTLR